MSRPRLLFAGLVVAVALNLAAEHPCSAQQQGKQETEPILSELSMEVNALETLHQLRLNNAQLEKLRLWAKETAQPPRQREPGKASKEFRAKLQEKRAALVNDDDNDLIDQVADQLNELREQEEPTIDDGVDVTPAARQRAPEAFKLLKANQLAGYVAQVADAVPDPLNLLRAAFTDVRQLKGSAWREKRDEIADEVSRLVVGLDVDKADRVNDRVAALLIRVHGLTNEEFARQQPDLDKAARKIVGNVSALEVLRHYVEVDLANLLSNPRLAAALEARLK
jgi:hypothetical protein